MPFCCRILHDIVCYVTFFIESVNQKSGVFIMLLVECFTSVVCSMKFYPYLPII